MGLVVGAVSSVVAAVLSRGTFLAEILVGVVGVLSFICSFVLSLFVLLVKNRFYRKAFIVGVAITVIAFVMFNIFYTSTEEACVDEHLNFCESLID